MTISEELLDELLSGVERPEDLLGDKGLMKELKVRLMERMLGAAFIPACIDQNRWAHWRIPIEMIFHGRSMSLFQASQQSTTMSS